MMPQEKMLQQGIESLSMEELIMLILRTGRKGKSITRIAHDVCEAISCINTNNIPKNIAQISGIGMAKSSTLFAVLELGKRMFGGKKTRLIISPDDVWKQMHHIASQTKEYFSVLYLNTRSQLIEEEVISVGNLNTSIAHPREVFEPAIRAHAAQILLCHNHPSGDVQPSEMDIQTTERLVKAGKILGIEVVDHVIITSHAYLSMKKERLI